MEGKVLQGDNIQEGFLRRGKEQTACLAGAGTAVPRRLGRRGATVVSRHANRELVDTGYILPTGTTGKRSLRICIYGAKHLDIESDT